MATSTFVVGLAASVVAIGVGFAAMSSYLHYENMEEHQMKEGYILECNVSHRRLLPANATHGFTYRTLWLLVLLALCALYYLTQHAPALLSLPYSLKDMGLGFAPSSSCAGRVAQAKAAAESEMYAGQGAYADVREIDALLHFLTAHHERRLEEDGGGSIRVEGLGSVVVDPEEPVDLRVYEPEGKDEWETYGKEIAEQFPLVVFSKTTCP